MVEALGMEGLENRRNLKLRNLCRVLCSNDFTEAIYLLSLNHLSLVHTQNYVRQLLFGPSVDMEVLVSYPDVVLFLDNFIHFCSGRALFKCVDGSFGLGPRAALPGDKLALWL